MQIWNRLSPAAQRWVLVFAAWTLFGLANSFAATEMSGKPFNPTDFAYEMLFWYTMALGTPAVFRLAERFPIERGQIVPRVAFHFGMAFLYTLVYGVVRTVFDAIHPDHILGSDPQASFWSNYLLLLGRSIRVVHFDYWALLGIGHALNSYRKLRDQEREASNLRLRAMQLESQLAGAQLEALRMQLNPHFLFNTLHSIAALVRENNRQDAVRMIAGLGDLLRQTLDIETAQEVPLKQEIEFLEKYLDIEQIRFQDRLRVRVDVEAAVCAANVPYLILQPLVENAVRHGISQNSKASLLEIRAWLQDGMLHMTVRDDGPGLTRSRQTATATGIGLRNTEARLRALYAENHEFSLTNADGGGAIAAMVIPFRPASLTETEPGSVHGSKDTSHYC